MVGREVGRGVGERVDEWAGARCALGGLDRLEHLNWSRLDSRAVREFQRPVKHEGLPPAMKRSVDFFEFRVFFYFDFI